MRILSQEEKDLCQRILNGSGENNFLGNIIDNKLGGVCIKVHKETKNVVLEFNINSEYPTDEESTEIIRRINLLSFFILTTVNLIELLEREGYILMLERGTTEKKESKFGGCISNSYKVTYHFKDKKISELLINYVDKEIIATEEFKRFCENKYIARDEQRFLKQILRTEIAIYIAFGALIVNIFINLIPKFTNGTKIKQEQIDTLVVPLKSIESKIENLNKKIDSIKINNTLKVKNKTESKKS